MKTLSFFFNAIIFCVVVSISDLCSADVGLRAEDQLSIENGQVKILGSREDFVIGSLRMWQAHTKLYSWTFHSITPINDSILENIIKNGDPNKHRGGGIYVSSNPTDSSNFGTNCALFDLQKSFYYFVPSQAIIRWSFDEWNLLNAKLKELGVSASAVQLHNPNWFVVYDSAILGFVHKATLNEVAPQNANLIYSPTEINSLKRAFPADPILSVLDAETKRWMEILTQLSSKAISQENIADFYSRATQPMIEEWFSKVPDSFTSGDLLNDFKRSGRISSTACYKFKICSP